MTYKYKPSYMRRHQQSRMRKCDRLALAKSQREMVRERVLQRAALLDEAALRRPSQFRVGRGGYHDPILKRPQDDLRAAQRAIVLELAQRLPTKERVAVESVLGVGTASQPGRPGRGIGDSPPGTPYNRLPIIERAARKLRQMVLDLEAGTQGE